MGQPCFPTKHPTLALAELCGVDFFHVPIGEKIDDCGRNFGFQCDFTAFSQHEDKALDMAACLARAPLTHPTGIGLPRTRKYGTGYGNRCSFWPPERVDAPRITFWFSEAARTSRGEIPRASTRHTSSAPDINQHDDPRTWTPPFHPEPSPPSASILAPPKVVPGTRPAILGQGRCAPISKVRRCGGS